jgi:hypothetical protein
VTWFRWISGTACLFVLGCGGGGGGDAAEPDVEFLNLRVVDIASDRAVVRFETNIETTCEVEYGLGAAEYDLSATDPDMDPENPFALDHRVPLEDLPATMTVYLRAKANNRGGRIFYSEPVCFVTLEASDVGAGEMVNVALLGSGARVTGVS